MKVFKTFGLALASLLMLAPFSWAGNWEYWSGFGIKVPLNKKVILNIKPQFRFKDDMSRFYYQKTYIGPTVKINKYFDLAVYDAYKVQKSKGKWEDDHIPTLDGIAKWELLTLKFSDRNRFEYSTDKEIWKYRNCLKVKKLIQLGNYKITPFVSEEIFYNFDSDEMDENRVSLGSTIKLTDSLEFSVSYLLKSKKEKGGWKSTNVLITSLSISF